MQLHCHWPREPTPDLRLMTSNDSYLACFRKRRCEFPQHFLSGNIIIARGGGTSRDSAAPRGRNCDTADSSPTLKPPDKSGISGIHSRYASKKWTNQFDAEVDTFLASQLRNIAFERL